LPDSKKPVLTTDFLARLESPVQESARWDLYGGCRVTAPSTATAAVEEELLLS